MTDNAKDAWGEVGEKFSSWGRQVADRYKEAGSTEAEVEESQRQLVQAAKDVVDELARGFTALGKTFRDEEANRELQDAVSAIGDAITATVSEASEGVRSGRSKSDASEPQGGAAPDEGDASAPPPPPPPTDG
jgi:DNA-binding ferritin-like protein